MFHVKSERSWVRATGSKFLIACLRSMGTPAMTFVAVTNFHPRIQSSVVFHRHLPLSSGPK